MVCLAEGDKELQTEAFWGSTAPEHVFVDKNGTNIIEITEGLVLRSLVCNEIRNFLYYS